MKKAYVKPVFLAEAYEVTTSVAACETRSNTPTEIWKGDYVCTHDNYGHTVGHGNGGPVKDYWSYATNGASPNGMKLQNGDDNTNAYLFTDSQVICDFVWNSYDSNVGVWRDESSNLISDMTKRDTEKSIIDYIGDVTQKFMWFFRGNGSDCGAIVVDGGTPFS